MTSGAAVCRSVRARLGRGVSPVTNAQHRVPIGRPARKSSELAGLDPSGHGRRRPGVRGHDGVGAFVPRYVGRLYRSDRCDVGPTRPVVAGVVAGVGGDAVQKRSRFRAPSDLPDRGQVAAVFHAHRRAGESMKRRRVVGFGSAVISGRKRSRPWRCDFTVLRRRAGAFGQRRRPRYRSDGLFACELSGSSPWTKMVLRARFDREDGRKRFIVGELLHGDTVCAPTPKAFSSGSIPGSPKGHPALPPDGLSPTSDRASAREPDGTGSCPVGPRRSW